MMGKIGLLALAMYVPLSFGAIGEDKTNHLAVSTVVGAASYYYTEDVATSMAMCTAVGVAKEVYDEIDYGGFDEKDLVADVVGCLVGVYFTETAFTFYSTGDKAVVKYTYKF